MAGVTMPPSSVLIPVPEASWPGVWRPSATWYVRILVSSALSASTLSRVALGSLANAALSGANTVMFDAELSVSTRPACLTAVTSVDSAGLAEAAVATGALDMPLKLPAPDFGTDEQAGPKSIAAAAGADDAALADDEARSEERRVGKEG